MRPVSDRGVVVQVHLEPLSDVVFWGPSLVTACQEGHVEVWRKEGRQRRSLSLENLNLSLSLSLNLPREKALGEGSFHPHLEDSDMVDSDCNM